jgi:hypothetical protein
MASESKNVWSGPVPDLSDHELKLVEEKVTSLGQMPGGDFAGMMKWLERSRKAQAVLQNALGFPRSEHASAVWIKVSNKLVEVSVVIAPDTGVPEVFLKETGVEPYRFGTVSETRDYVKKLLATGVDPYG